VSASSVVGGVFNWFLDDAIISIVFLNVKG